MNQIVKARLLGLLVMVIGIAGTIYNWYSLVNKNVYLLKASFLFPFFAIFGFSIIIFPTTKEKNLEKYGREQLHFSDFPIGQKILIVIGIISGVLNWSLLSGRITIF